MYMDSKLRETTYSQILFLLAFLSDGACETTLQHSTTRVCIRATDRQCGGATPRTYLVAGCLIKTSEDSGPESEQVLEQVSPPQLI